MDLIIETIGSAALFYNKMLLRKKNSWSWIIGMIGVLLMSILTYQKQLWINLGFHVGIVILLIYGYLVAINILRFNSKFWERFLRILIITLTFLFCVYLFIETQNSGRFGNSQLVQAISALFGVLFLGFNTRNSCIVGWISNIISHTTATYVMSSNGFYIVAFFQILSIIVALKAIKDEHQRRPPDII